MEIVLLDDVINVGGRYEVKKVAAGYARNYLLPRGLAAPANPAMLRQVEQLKKKHQAELARRQETADKFIGQLSDAVVTIKAKANEQGHLFEGLDRQAIAAAVKGQIKVDFDPEWLQLERPLKALGDYELIAAPAASVGRRGQIKIRVVAADY